LLFQLVADEFVQAADQRTRLWMGENKKNLHSREFEDECDD
jgi:hypothetical protein